MGNWSIVKIILWLVQWASFGMSIGSLLANKLPEASYFLFVSFYFSVMFDKVEKIDEV